jgi:hypothetical protein
MIPAVQTAVDAKIADQTAFVAWWDATVRPNHRPDVALAQQEITVIDEPGPRVRHQLGFVEHRGCFAPQIGDEAAFGMIARLRAAERGEGGRLMVVQGAAAPVERPDRGEPRRRATELAPEISSTPGGMSSTELSVPPVIFRKPIWSASASRFNTFRRRRTAANSSSPSVKKCSISNPDKASGKLPAEIAVLPSAHARTLRNWTGALLTIMVPSAR